MKYVWKMVLGDPAGGEWVDEDASSTVTTTSLPSFAITGTAVGSGAPSTDATAGAASTQTLTQQMKSGPLSMLDTQLAAYVMGPQAAAPSASTNTVMSGGTNSLAVSALQPDQGVTIDFTAKDGNGAALLAALNSLGLQHGSSFGAIASGVLPTADIAALTTLPTLGFARVSAVHTLLTPIQGSVVTQADTDQHDDIARSTYNVDGTGLKIGIISDSFNTSGNADSMATDIASGDLPADTTILQDYPGGTDEGRAMAQLVHDIAPNASIEFATANYGEAGFANNIIALAQAGAKVIVDDVHYYDDSAYQDGIIAQAVNQVTAMGVTYFASAGNDGHKGYEAPFNVGTTPITFAYNGVTYTADQFSNGQIRIPVTFGSSMVFNLQWDQPSASVGNGSPGSQSDLDLFLTDANGNILTYSNGTPIVSTNNNIGGDPDESVGRNGGSAQAYIEIGLRSGPAPTDLKLVLSDDGSGATITEPTSNTNDGTTYGHAAAVGTIAVGASAFYKTPNEGQTPPLIESFSSGGPVTVSFDASGNRLATPESRATPAFTAVDGGNTTFFGTDSSHDTDSLPNFFGTSAAAPDAAATALLMLQARGTLTSDDIRHLLMDSAIDMDNPATTGFDTGYDYGTGSGLIQADLAVGYASTLTYAADATHLTMIGSHLADTFNVTSTGAHVLTGSGGADTFAGTGANLNGATITDFASADKIHFTDAVFGLFTDQYTASTGVLTYTLGTQASQSITLARNLTGQFSQMIDPNGGVDVLIMPSVSIASVTGGNNEVNHVVSGSVDIVSDPQSIGTTVTVADGATSLGTTTVNGDGSWSLPITYLGDGPTHALVLTASDTDSGGYTGTSSPFTFNLDFNANKPLFGVTTYNPNSGAGEIYALYDTILARAPDAAGFEALLARFNAGTSISDLAQTLLQSSEYTTRAGDVTQTTNTAFLTDLYQTSLGRAPDPGGLQYWSSQLAGGESRSDVATAFALSPLKHDILSAVFDNGLFVPDATDGEVSRLYYGILDRAPDPQGLAFWESQAQSGTSVTTIAQDFLGSQEYAGQHPSAPSNSDYVNQIYEGALGRAGTDSGAQQYVAALAAGTTSRATVATSVTQGTESLTHLASKIEDGFHIA